MRIFSGTMRTFSGCRWALPSQLALANSASIRLVPAENYDSGCLFRLCARAHLQIDVRLRDTQLLEKITGYGHIIVLAGVDQAVSKRTPLRPSRPQGIDGRRDLYDVGPRAGDEIVALHLLASISMNRPYPGNTDRKRRRGQIRFAMDNNQP
jgi:hypothetical protein